MKLLLANSLVGSALAGFISLTDEFNKAIQRHSKRPSNFTQQLMRHGINFGPSLDNLNGWGCWCYFNEEDHGKGKGQPVNELDHLCRSLHDGYDCTEMDDASCLAHTQEHEVEYPPPMPNGWFDESDWPDLRAACEAANADQCGQRACAIESYFMAELLKIYVENDFSVAALYGAGGAFDSTYRHSNGFDPATSCQTVNGGGGGAGGSGGVIGGTGGSSGSTGDNNKVCCGEYPLRFPYHTDGGSRSCCGQKTYDASLLSCCTDNTIQMVCS